ncbi:LLM class flavin-dependent oxidoreductase [Acidisoma silvae]|uniref:LLM class flavin-dependent oxidoreductase n=1 Tax=Acidisoma silvae TaxID=2802396 RepID=A0A963YU00_9PROT|nr:LLM class flavin-dependent oxidoreductase [Acidisoma silvae]MCB8877018.1 LLM class flavin-dependent oxidoreductase [Acidisoma silvae]
MAKPLRLNAFTMATPDHLSPGLWRHPRSDAARYHRRSYWTDLAKILERGLFDGLFIADTLGVSDVFKGGRDTALADGLHVPINDPLLAISAMAEVTEHLGFGVTVSMTYEHPFQLARRMSTLDHLTDGRMGWNMVTSSLDSASRAFGRSAQLPHDARYDMADEYAALCYKLWEGSWSDRAVINDTETGRYVDPTQVRTIHHDGPHFKLDAMHLCEPSPQRTPVLYQAGASPRGRRFGAENAECIFIGAPSKPVLGKFVRAARDSIRAAGRDPHEVLIFAEHTVILGKTDAEAAAKEAEYRRYCSDESALALMSGWIGTDLSRYKLDDPFHHVDSNAIRTAVEAMSSAAPDRVWTIREIAAWCGIGGLSPVTTGSPERVADSLIAWAEETDIDGFNLAHAVTHESFSDIADLLVPELQRRGVYKQAYAPGTLRQKLFGQGDRLAAHHPAARYRWPTS